MTKLFLLGATALVLASVPVTPSGEHGLRVSGAQAAYGHYARVGRRVVRRDVRQGTRRAVRRCAYGVTCY